MNVMSGPHMHGMLGMADQMLVDGELPTHGMANSRSWRASHAVLFIVLWIHGASMLYTRYAGALFAKRRCAYGC